MWPLTALVTVVFYFILAYFGTANLIPSTLSVGTSFLAVYLSARRSPFYALAYAANDIVLIVLWIMASLSDIRYISVVVCFVAFLFNDMYAGEEPIIVNSNLTHKMLMDKFKKGINWNFFAFICPLAWSLYRKMYKLSALIFAVYVLIFGTTGYFIMNDEGFVKANEVCMQENPQYFTDISAYLSGNGDYSLTPAQQELIKEMETIEIPRAVGFLCSALPFVIRVLVALFSTKLYYEKLRKNIEKAENKGLYGDELKNYLHRKYGTLPLIIAGIVGIIEMSTFYF